MLDGYPLLVSLSPRTLLQQVKSRVACDEERAGRGLLPVKDFPRKAILPFIADLFAMLDIPHRFQGPSSDGHTALFSTSHK